MHRGEIVEKAPVEAFFSAPGHPYARALVAAHLCLHAHDAALERARFQRMEGRIVNLLELSGVTKTYRQAGCSAARAVIWCSTR
jgi:ABC-type dipeptide/oligopeptide/nickel transport system ATPase component